MVDWRVRCNSFPSGTFSLAIGLGSSMAGTKEFESGVASTKEVN